MLLFGTLNGILVAIIVSVVSLASQVANPAVYAIGRKRGADVLRPLSPEHPDDETFEGLLIARPEGRIFFMNAEAVAAKLRALIALYRPRVVALDMSRVPDIEYSALEARRTRVACKSRPAQAVRTRHEVARTRPRHCAEPSSARQRVIPDLIQWRRPDAALAGIVHPGLASDESSSFAAAK